MVSGVGAGAGRADPEARDRAGCLGFFLLTRAADNGTLTMWDYATGLPFQHLKDIPQPGSLDAEAVSLRCCDAVVQPGVVPDRRQCYGVCFCSLTLPQGVFCSTFDRTGTRLITGGADKTIKVYSEVA